MATAWQRDLPSREDDDGIPVYRLRGLVSRVPALSADPVRYTPPPFPDPELSWRLRRLIRRLEPDVVHSYGWLTYSCLPALWGTGIPLLLAARDYGNVCAVRTLVHRGKDFEQACSGPAWGKCVACSSVFYGRPKGVVAAASVLGQRGALRRRTDALHSVSRFSEMLMRHHLLGNKLLISEVVPDFREDDLDGAVDLTILDRLPREPFILFVGAFRRNKGDQLLIQAYDRLENPPPLVMVGGRSAEPLPHFSAGITPIVDVPHSTVMAIWERALFGVCPSLVPEPLGNTVHEGMSKGKAVIGTTPGGHQDMIDSDRNGILVPLGDVDALTNAIERLIADPAMRDRLGQQARVSAQAFTPDVVMPRLESLCVAAASARQRG